MRGMTGAVLAVLLFGPVTSWADDAARIVASTFAAYRGVGTEREEVDVLIVSSSGDTAFTSADVSKLWDDGERRVTRKRARRDVVYAQTGDDKIFVGLSAPPDDAGTNVLILRRRPPAADEQWMYLPALKRVRQVALNDGQTFVGTNFLFEDLRELAGERTERYVYTVRPDEIVDGRNCTVIEATSATGFASAYARRRMWIDRARNIPLRIDYEASGGTVRKRLRNTAVREVAPGIARADLVQMHDFGLDETTILRTRTREVGVILSDDLFSPDSLAHGSDR